MTRALLIKLHLYLSAFFSAAIILVAVSGGLYLIGIKGSVEQTPVGTLSAGQQLLANPSQSAVESALAEAGVSDFRFDYVKQKGAQLITRPTTRLATNAVGISATPLSMEKPSAASALLRASLERVS